MPLLGVAVVALMVLPKLYQPDVSPSSKPGLVSILVAKAEQGSGIKAIKASLATQKTLIFTA